MSQKMIFDGLFGKKEAPNKETPGKFVRHRELENAGAAFGPRGIVCAGFGEEELEVLAERVEQVLGSAEVRKCSDVSLLCIDTIVKAAGEVSRLNECADVHCSRQTKFRSRCWARTTWMIVRP